jgi:hypothetical protein
MMPLLRPLFEAWLLDATQGPLAPWKRRLLKRALDRDEALRCLAAELAQFSYEAHAPAADKAPDLRPRLRALTADAHTDAPLFPSPWVPAGAIAFLLLLAVIAILQRAPEAAPALQQAASRQDGAAQALMQPSPTPTPATTALVPAAATASSPTAAAQPESPSAKP